MAQTANLDQLHDLALPPTLNAWPQTPFVYAVVILFGLILLWLICQRVRRWRADRYRRVGLQALNRLQRQCLNEPQRLSELPQLLKACALAAWPRRQVAALSGPDWLLFLQQQSPTSPLPALLGELSYWPTERIAMVPQRERDALLNAARHWLHNHVHP